jgi:hypothetical protein
MEWTFGSQDHSLPIGQEQALRRAAGLASGIEYRNVLQDVQRLFATKSTG